MQNWRRMLVINVLATCFMVGLVWFVQVVHYPLFSQVGMTHWESYHRDHARLTTYLVAPTMLIEAATGLGLLLQARRLPRRVQACLLVAAGLLLVNWLSTIGVQVKIHEKVAIDFRPEVVDRLVLTNWVRTVAWSARGLIMGYVLLWALSPEARAYEDSPAAADAQGRLTPA